MHFFVDWDESSIFVLIMEGVEMTEEMINPRDYKSHMTQSSNGPVKIFWGGAFWRDHFLNCCRPSNELVIRKENGKSPKIE